MCGIVAIYHHDPQYYIDHDILVSMNNSQHHRGPDGSGVFIDECIGLAHTRLSIIDLDSGQQPLFDDTKSAVISFNGEIYNYQVLRQELIELGYTFSTQSDTEVLLNAWLAWNTDCLMRLNGMFAFVIYDKEKKQLFAARDRLGIKPLHWTTLHDGGVIFSSELKAIKQHPDIQLELNHQSIEDFLSLGYIIEPKSIYKSVNKLLPGHYILLEQQSHDIQPCCYWDVKSFIDNKETEYKTDDVQLKLSKAIKERLVADVPLGAFLSGGLDSTAIVAFMNQASPEKIATSTIGFDLSQFDESFYAEKAAKIFDTDHSTTNVSVNDLSMVDVLVDIFDEPFADNSAIPTLILSKVTRSRVKVALSGDGSDELFYGYRNYQMLNMEEKVRRIIPRSVRKPLFGVLAKIYPKLDGAPRYLRAKSTFKALAGEGINSFHNAMSLIGSETLSSLYSFEFKNQLNGYQSLNTFKHLANEVAHLPVIKQAQYIDFKTYLSGDILTKVDRASMANSLEVRVPFLDYNVVQWGLGLSEKLNLQGNKVKQVLVKSLKGLVPSFILNRKKMGFTSPLDEWIRQIPQHTLEKKIFNTAFLSANIFDVKALKLLIHQHQNRQLNNGVFIWALLILAAFLQKESQRNKTKL